MKLKSWTKWISEGSLHELGGSVGKGAPKEDPSDEALKWGKERSLSSSVDRLICWGRRREVKK